MRFAIAVGRFYEDLAERLVGDQIEIGPAAIRIRERTGGTHHRQPQIPRCRIHRAVSRLAVSMLIVEGAVAAAQTGLAVAGDVPREPDPRPEIMNRRVGAILGNARIAAERA